MCDDDPLLVEVDVHLQWPGTAVKLAHLPTGIEAVSDSEETQLANRGRALELLREALAATWGE